MSFIAANSVLVSVSELFFASESFANSCSVKPEFFIISMRATDVEVSDEGRLSSNPTRSQ